MIVVFLGPPGCGKGTQASLLKDKGFLPLSTGDLLRKEVQSSTELGEKIRSVLGTGHLVDDDLVSDLVTSHIMKSIDHSIILDGFPRTLAQAERLGFFLKDHNLSLFSVVHFQIKDDILLKRIGGRFSCTHCREIYNTYFHPLKKEGICDVCGASSFSKRSDDEELVLRQRLLEYHKQTELLIDFYKDNLLTVDAERPVKEVHEKLTTFLGLSN